MKKELCNERQSVDLNDKVLCESNNQHQMEEILHILNVKK